MDACDTFATRVQIKLVEGASLPQLAPDMSGRRPLACRMRLQKKTMGSLHESTDPTVDDSTGHRKPKKGRAALQG